LDRDKTTCTKEESGFFIIYIHFDFLTSKLLVCKTKSDMLLPFVFILPVAEKGPDRSKHGQALSHI
ncbi:hypothetical protein, partial [Bacillus pseudomycoides]|uniref:hypothetical protein n=1 Tax=Bacillus pseudomycoides TaxID=64104 RepID=UPI003000B2B6